MSESTNNELRVTSGEEWRLLRQKGIVIELPSGRVARLRPVTIEGLMMAGRVPNFLMALVAEMMGLSGNNEKVSEDQLLRTTTQYLELQKILLTEMFLEPRIVDDPQAADEIAFLDVAAKDRDWAIAWAQAPVARLANFRNEE